MKNNRKLVPSLIMTAVFVLLGIQIYTMPNRAQKHLEREGYTDVKTTSLFLKFPCKHPCYDEEIPMAFSATKDNQRFEGYVCCETYFLIFEDYDSKNITVVAPTQRPLPQLDSIILGKYVETPHKHLHASL